MKVHTTNYYNSFIEVAEDCTAVAGMVPPDKPIPSIAKLQYDKIRHNPYKFSSDEVLFWVAAVRREFSEEEMELQRQQFFSKGQACFRASPLPKNYGWGVHFDASGKMALYGRENSAYAQFLKDENITKLKAMRSKKA
ncbi:MAG TPA: DUF6157 family protein [Cyclobacteriaceae bacterium]|nr:DUF6157 family protein [Cyclobacteriaceae bacterium]